VITALVEIDVERGRVAETAQRIVDIEGMAEVWSVTGGCDLVALVKLHEFDALAEVVAETVAAMPEVLRTNTVLAFKVYSKQDLEESFAVGAG